MGEFNEAPPKILRASNRAKHEDRHRQENQEHEYRAGMAPAGVREIVHHGHDIVVESVCGADIGFDDDANERVGATILGTAQDVFDKAYMIIKVMEQQSVECKLLGEGQVLFTYLHLSADRPQTRALAESGATCITYETVRSSNASYTDE